MNTIAKIIKISVIIPHYNIPDLLVRALRSIPKRDDVQVIVVDDGSPNADKYIVQYPELSASNVEFYPQEHCGLAGRMRNIGMSYAKGKWITFLDADDFFSEEANFIFDEVQQYAEDMVFYNSRAVMSDDLSKESNRNVYSGVFEMEAQERERLLRYTYHSPIGKFIKLEFIQRNALQFDETPYANDAYFSIKSGILAKNIRVCQDVLYVITERGGSLTTQTIGTSKRRKEECQVRYDVAYRSHMLLRENGIRLSVNYDPLVIALGLFRAKYKKEYYKKLMHMLFVYPACAWHYIKKDFNYIFLGVRNPSGMK